MLPIRGIITQLLGVIATSNEIPCLIWPYHRNPGGYGTATHEGETKLAHRIIYELAHGPIPTGLHVLHTCNNGHLGCVNPNHLKVGTDKDNANDKARAGRQQQGESVPVSVLTNAQIPYILELFNTMRVTHIARMLGISRGAVNDVVIGRTFKWQSIGFYCDNNQSIPHRLWMRRHGHHLTKWNASCE